MARKQIEEIIGMKKNKQKIVMLTAYDYPMATIIDQAGVDIILVGDSLANVVLGLDSTNEVDIEAMLHHTKAVNRAVNNAMLMGDMPYQAYQQNPNQALENARRFVDEGGCSAVKIEWFDGCVEVAKKIVEANIPLMGHVGLTPQRADELGGMKVQGREAKDAINIMKQAKQLEEAGVFAVVLECIPASLAKLITEQLSIPTIGIGAGVHCDGQVLVLNDLLGLFDRYHPKFVKQYTNLSLLVNDAVEQYSKEVRGGQFPDIEHSYLMKEDQLKKIKESLDG